MGLFLNAAYMNTGCESIGASEKLVLTILAMACDDNGDKDDHIGERVIGGNSYLSHQMICHYTGLSVRTIKRSLSLLEDNGWIRKMTSERHNRSYKGFGRRTINWQLNLSMLVRKIDAEATIKGKNINYRSEEARALIAAAEMVHDNDWETTLTAWSRGYKGKVLPWDGTVKDATPSLWGNTSTATEQPEIVEGFITPEKLL